MLGLLLCCTLVASALALDNGLARTPPMGWISWQRFRCNTDCKQWPDDCISEKLYMQMADHMAADGYKEAGYEYVNIDDCWAAKERDPKTMKLVPDPERFPSGMKALADYVHSKGLKLGTYGDMGTKTCGGWPGSKFTMELDAQTLAEWGIDSWKMDGCYSDTSDFYEAYPIMSHYLNKTGRPILFSCSWPAYEVGQKTPIPYQRIAEYCNIWRNYDDIDDSWDSVTNIIGWYGNDKWNFSSVSGPGHYNDPDMIIVGNKGLSYSESQAQMAMWAMMASPLFLSADLRTVSAEMRDLMQHKGVISINQDPLGIMGKRIWQAGGFQLWTRPITPRGSYAICVLNTNTGGFGSKTTLYLQNFAIVDKNNFKMTEIFEGKEMGTYNQSTPLTIFTDVSSVFFARLDPVQN